MKHLFNNKTIYNKNNNLQLLEIYFGRYFDINSFEQFSNNYTNYFKNECNNNINNIRKLNTLMLLDMPDSKLYNILIKGLSPNFEHLYINNSVTLLINTK